MVITLTTTDESCLQNDGAISTSVSGGTSPYTYLWSTSATSANLSGLTNGSYSVTVTDGNSCTEVRNTTINDACASTSGINPSTQLLWRNEL